MRIQQAGNRAQQLPVGCEVSSKFEVGHRVSMYGLAVELYRSLAGVQLAYVVLVGRLVYCSNCPQLVTKDASKESETRRSDRHGTSRPQVESVEWLSFST